MKTFTIIYSSDQVTQLNYSTSDGFIGTVGTSSARDSSKSYSFDQTNYKFYGVYGTDDGFIASLGVIRTDTRCLQSKVYELGDDFGWDVSPADVSANSSDAEAVQSEEEIAVDETLEVEKATLTISADTIKNVLIGVLAFAILVLILVCFFYRRKQ